MLATERTRGPKTREARAAPPARTLANLINCTGTADSTDNAQRQFLIARGVPESRLSLLAALLWEASQ